MLTTRAVEVKAVRIRAMIIRAHCLTLKQQYQNSIVLQSDLNTTRLYATQTSVIRGFFSESWYPQLFLPISMYLGTCLSIYRHWVANVLTAWSDQLSSNVVSLSISSKLDFSASQLDRSQLHRIDSQAVSCEM